MSIYEGFLSMGGNEIVNNTRVRRIAESAQPCPMYWLKGDVCDAMPEALFQDSGYDWSTISDAPWFDPDAPESADFYGFFATAITEAMDSTRSVSRTEGITDGGVLGRTRKATKQMRVKGLLMGRGRRAIEYGQAWLSAAVDPGACGQHGTECGLTDVEWFADCPPVRGQIGYLGEWEERARNLVLNPSFEAAGAAVEVHRNIVYGAPGGILATRTNGVAFDGDTWYQFAATGQPGGMRHTVTGLVDGQTYTFSAEVANPGATPVTLSRVSFSDLDLHSVVLAPGERRMVTATAVRAAYGSLNFADVRANNGQTFLIRLSTVVAGPLANPVPFDGSEMLTPDPDLTPSWTGAANASVSILSGNSVANVAATASQVIVYQTSDRPDTGDYALRASVKFSGAIGVPVTGVALTIGTTYTMMMKARASRDGLVTSPRIRQANGSPVTLTTEWQEIRTTLAAGSGSSVTGTGLLLSTSTHQYGDLIDIDSVVIVEGEYTGPFFDGNTPTLDPEHERFTWIGAENASQSTYEARADLERPQTDEEYLATVNGYVRYLHDAAAISGPIITNTLESGDFMAYEVEMIFAAERPWVYGITRDVNLPPTLPIVVQDIPYNLVPYPSAELAAGNVVVALNLSNNPSVESNATGWSAISDGAGIAPANIAGARSTALAAVGLASYRVLFTAPTAGVASAWFGAQQQVTIPSTPGRRYSVNLWAAAVPLAGSSSLGDIRMFAIWRNNVFATLRTDDLGTLDNAGGVVSAKSLTPPAGATNVVVRAYVEVNSWSNGATIQLFTDALAVTVP